MRCVHATPQDSLDFTRDQVAELLPHYLQLESRLKQLDSQSAASLETLREVQQVSAACLPACLPPSKLARCCSWSLDRVLGLVLTTAGRTSLLGRTSCHIDHIRTHCLPLHCSALETSCFSLRAASGERR
jgi:hypothetical protein